MGNLTVSTDVDGFMGSADKAAMRTNLGATTVGKALMVLTNPGAITFLRVNADNSVTALSAADFITALGITTGITTDRVVIGAGGPYIAQYSGLAIFSPGGVVQFDSSFGGYPMVVGLSITTNDDIYLFRGGAGVLNLNDRSNNGGMLECYQRASIGTPNTNCVRFGGEDVSGISQAFVANESGVKTQLSGDAVFPLTIQVGIYTVGTLPSASPSGKKAFVTDATLPVFGATVAGSGAVLTPVYSDGTNWKVG